MNKICTYIPVGILFCIMVLFFFKVSKMDKKWCDETNNEFLNMRISAEVKSVFIDSSNHLAHSVMLDDSIILQFTVDTSSFYQQVKPRDFLIKSRNSNIIIVQKGSGVKEFSIYYDCY